MRNLLVVTVLTCYLSIGNSRTEAQGLAASGVSQGGSIAAGSPGRIDAVIDIVGIRDAAKSIAGPTSNQRQGTALANASTSVTGLFDVTVGAMADFKAVAAGTMSPQQAAQFAHQRQITALANPLPFSSLADLAAGAVEDYGAKCAADLSKQLEYQAEMLDQMGNAGRSVKFTIIDTSKTDPGGKHNGKAPSFGSSGYPSLDMTGSFGGPSPSSNGTFSLGIDYKVGLGLAPSSGSSNPGGTKGREPGNSGAGKSPGDVSPGGKPGNSRKDPRDYGHGR